MSDWTSIPCDAPSREDAAYREFVGKQLEESLKRITWQWTLAHNLTVAALGWAAFELGRAHAQFAEAYFEGNTDEGEEWPFEPGRGKAAL